MRAMNHFCFLKLFFTLLITPLSQLYFVFVFSNYPGVFWFLLCCENFCLNTVGGISRQINDQGGYACIVTSGRGLKKSYRVSLGVKIAAL